MKNMIIASTSTVYGGGYLEYLMPEIIEHFKDCPEILFIPYARPNGITHDAYTKKVAVEFKKHGMNVVNIDDYEDPVEAVNNAKGIFTGGGNTFLLVTKLYQNKIMEPMAKVIKAGTKYLGSSAGSNICGLTMQTTNDMPIIFPPSFKTLALFPFNINPHYLDPDPNTKHMGETREIRIKEFHNLNPQPVIGLREGSWLEIKGKKVILHGELQARIFEKNKEPFEVESGTDLSLLK
uniref:dipeptidase PepE n=1 Tax=Flavobacterium sp. TaxID=239 RepID=UPI00404A9953